jgi:hypothetical protein
MYYTTPIYQFRMKCHLCTNHWIIKTDPGNLDYVIVEGATRQERRWDPTDNGQVNSIVSYRNLSFAILDSQILFPGLRT